MRINKYLLLSTMFAGVLSTYATEARVESMGKNSNFIMDDISIFDNAANIGVYQNQLIGGFGTYQDSEEGDLNIDPQSPSFGGIFSIGIGDNKKRDPKFFIGGVLNRQDELLSLLPDSVIVEKASGNSQNERIAVPSTVTNIDGFLGLSSPEGNLFGLHIYTAVQDGVNDNGDVNSRYFASVLRLDGGVNFSFNEEVDWEISAGVNRIDFGDSKTDFLDLGEFGYNVETRMFSTLEALNGEFVPHMQYRVIQSFGIDKSDFSMGVGINVGMERGFFWMGLEYVNEIESTEGWTMVDGKSIVDQHPNNENQYGTDRRTETGAVVSFGIERNIWWDWLVVRVGGKKRITWVECNPSAIGDEKFDTSYCGEEGSYLATNPLGDGTNDDHIGFGFGINVEEKLKVDVTVAEDLLFRNPFNGSRRLFSRISATYAF